MSHLKLRVVLFDFMVQFWLIPVGLIWQSFFVYYWKEFTKISNGLQIYSFFKILNVYVALKDQNSKKEFCRQLSQNYCSETIGNNDHMSTNIYWSEL